MKDFATVVIAAIVGFIAWEQKEINRIKVQHDLFERRFSVYSALIDFLHLVAVDGFLPTDPKRTAFLVKSSESHFLFKGNEISDYLAEVNKKAEELNAAILQIDIRNLPIGESVAEKYRARKWFLEQLETGARNKFSEHLKLY